MLTFRGEPKFVTKIKKLVDNLKKLAETADKRTHLCSFSRCVADVCAASCTVLLPDPRLFTKHKSSLNAFTVSFFERGSQLSTGPSLCRYFSRAILTATYA